MRRSVFLRLFGLLFLATATSAVGIRSAEAQDGKAEAGKVSFDKLVELNADAIFGGKLTRKKDRFTLDFPAEGQFERGFECKGRGRGQIISNLKDLKRQDIKKTLVDGHKGGKPSFVAVGAASAISNFELADEFKISFRMRAPSVDKRAKLIWFINRGGRRDIIQSSFFTSLSAGSKAKARTKNKIFAGLPARWFDRRAEGMHVEIIFKDKKATIRVGHYGGKDGKQKIEDVVSVDVEKPTSGKLGFQFDKLSFLMMNFRIEGKFPKEWVEKEIERLRKAKKLRTAEAVDVAKKDGKKGGKKGGDAKGGKGGDQALVKRRKKREKPDLDKSDPEADEDL